jgi:hypothetical protein
MFDDEGAVVAEGFSLDHIVDVVAKPGGTVDIGAVATLRRGGAEESEAPGRSLLWLWYFAIG